jgi:hypothetical protein
MIGKLIEPVTGLLDKFIEDKDQKAQLAHDLATMADRHAQDLALAQIEVNKAEAASGSLFKGGWRPAVGWVCGYRVCLPLCVAACDCVCACAERNRAAPAALPQFDMTSLMTVLMGMLGLGGLRTYEKKQGIAK